MIMDTYRPAVLVGGKAGARTNPRMATILQPVMCQVRSLYFPEVHETKRVPKPATKYGGQVYLISLRSQRWIGGTHQDQSENGSLAESLDDRREEVLEPVGGLTIS
jgi:hypothetical protein